MPIMTGKYFLFNWEITMRRTEQLAKTRTSILKTATRLFMKKGYALTSTRDIAKEIGITQPALYHHFNDKEVLYLEVLSEHGRKISDEINQVMRRKSLTAEERLWQLARVFLKNNPTNTYDRLQYTKSQLSTSGQRKLEMIYLMDYIEPLSKFFRLPEVKLRPDLLPKEAAELFLSAMTPLFGMIQPVGGTMISQEQRNKLILDVFINGVKKPEKSGK